MLNWKNVFQLGLKEFMALYRDPAMLVLILWSFSAAIYTAGHAQSDTLHKVAIAVVDQDQSQLSKRLTDAFYPPDFLAPRLLNDAEADELMDRGQITFSLTIPPDFQRDVLAGREPELQLNVDATQTVVAMAGGGHIQTMLTQEVATFLNKVRGPTQLPVNLVTRVQYNPNLSQEWFASVMEIINNVTMLAIILAGAALIREREHGTVEHLLVMPLTPIEIMLAKIWSMSLVVWLASLFALLVVVKGIMGVQINGSITLYMLGTALHLFAVTSMGIALGTVARSMPQFGLLMIMLLIPLMILSGSRSPRESMPVAVQYVMDFAPNTHFVAMAQAILYRGAGIDVVWPQFVFIGLIGGGLFWLAARRFRATIAQLAN